MFYSHLLRYVIFSIEFQICEKTGASDQGLSSGAAPYKSRACSDAGPFFARHVPSHVSRGSWTCSSTVTCTLDDALAATSLSRISNGEHTSTPSPATEKLATLGLIHLQNARWMRGHRRTLHRRQGAAHLSDVARTARG